MNGICYILLLKYYLRIRHSGRDDVSKKPFTRRRRQKWKKAASASASGKPERIMTVLPFVGCDDSRRILPRSLHPLLHLAFTVCAPVIAPASSSISIFHYIHFTCIQQTSRLFLSSSLVVHMNLINARTLEKDYF